MKTLNIWVCLWPMWFITVSVDTFLLFVKVHSLGFQIFFRNGEEVGEDRQGASHSSCNSLTHISGEHKHEVVFFFVLFFLAITESIHPLCHLEDEILFFYSCHCQHHH